MDGFGQVAVRGADGRFVAGHSGNPAGKRPGTRNRATVLAAALREGEAEAIARMVIDKALDGDAVAARFCLDRLTARPRGRAVHLDLPDDAGAGGDVVAAFNATLRGMASGEITPDEAVTIARFLDGRRRVLQAKAIENELTRYGEEIPGDASAAIDSMDDEGDDAEEDNAEEEGFPDGRIDASEAPPLLAQSRLAQLRLARLRLAQFRPDRSATLEPEHDIPISDTDHHLAPSALPLSSPLVTTPPACDSHPPRLHSTCISWPDTTPGGIDAEEWRERLAREAAAIV